MVKYHYEDGRLEACEVGGECVRMAAEIGLMLSLIYNGLFDMDADAAEAFKDAFLGMVNRPEVWNREQLPITHAGEVIWKPETDGEG